MSPYRTPAKNEDALQAVESDRPDGDLVAVLFGFWVISVVRVAGGILHYETFGAEATLALLAVLLVPLLLHRAGARWLRRLASAIVGRRHSARFRSR
jgi:hypothetical protein